MHFEWVISQLSKLGLLWHLVLSSKAVAETSVAPAMTVPLLHYNAFLLWL